MGARVRVGERGEGAGATAVLGKDLLVVEEHALIGQLHAVPQVVAARHVTSRARPSKPRCDIRVIRLLELPLHDRGHVVHLER